jgi:hypothetical protein
MQCAKMGHRWTLISRGIAILITEGLAERSTTNRVLEQTYISDISEWLGSASANEDCAGDDYKTKPICMHRVVGPKVNVEIWGDDCPKQ